MIFQVNDTAEFVLAPGEVIIDHQLGTYGTRGNGHYVVVIALPTSGKFDYKVQSLVTGRTIDCYHHNLRRLPPPEDKKDETSQTMHNSSEHDLPKVQKVY